MKYLLVAAVALLSLPCAGLGQPTSNTSDIVSSHEVQGLMRAAHSSEQYKQLASYFHRRELDYRGRAAAERIERDRRAQVKAGLYQKYPRPVDSAEHLYESFVAAADTAALEAHRYDQLMMAEDPHTESSTKHAPDRP